MIALAIWVCMAQDQSNGYMDYLKAGEILEKNHFSQALADATEKIRLGEFKSTVAKSLTSQFGGIFDIVKVGNRKSVRYPGDFGPDTTFPEIGQFRGICKLYAYDIYTKFCEGAPNSAVDSAIEALDFSYNVRCGPLIFYLVGIACQSIILAEIDGEISSISLSGARKLSRAAEKLLQRSSGLGIALESERAFALRAVAAIIDSGDAGDLESEGGDISRQLKALSPSQKESLKAEMLKLIQAEFDYLLKRRDSVGKSEPKPDIAASNLAKQVLELSTPVWEQVFIAEMRTATQMKILRLTCLVIEYRWLHGELPQSLAELGNKELLLDALNGGPYIYERGVGGSFTIYSAGNDDIPAMGLRRRGT